MEIWKKVHGYYNYECSNLGRIKTFNWKNSKKEAIMKPALDGSGYYRTVLKRQDGKLCTIKVHRIILMTFKPIENSNYLECNHINGIKNDNNINNLEWVTRHENLKHSMDNNLQYVLKGEEIGNSKLKEFQVKEIRSKFVPRLYSRIKLAKEYNVSEATIKDILYKRSWTHIL
jgi:hypothetical protein